MDLSLVKRSKKEDIKANMNIYRRKGVEVDLSVGTIKVNCDYTDLSNWQGAAQLLDATGATSAQIRDYNNGYHTVTRADIDLIINKILVYGQQLYGRKWAADSAVDSAQTAAEVEEVTF